MTEAEGIPVALLRELLHYDPTTGKLRWTDSPKNGRKAGRAVGTVSRTTGAVVLRLLGKVRLAHRVIWAVHHGKFSRHTIDHINHDRADNRIANLRDVPHAANMRNHPARPMLVAATPLPDGRWTSAVHEFGDARPLGDFATIEQANSAWEAARTRVLDPDAPRPRVRVPTLEHVEAVRRIRAGKKPARK